MTTPAEHANTVREAATVLADGATYPADELETLLAALDALQAQAEEWRGQLADEMGLTEQQRARAEAAEAERDRALDREAVTSDALDEMRAVFDRLREGAA